MRVLVQLPNTSNAGEIQSNMVKPRRTRLWSRSEAGMVVLTSVSFSNTFK